MFARHRASTIVAVVTLGCGIGANTTIFSLVNTLVLHALPYPNADRLVHVETTYGESSTTGEGVSLPDINDIQARNHVFESIAFFVRGTGVTLTGVGAAARLSDVDISPGLFKVLKVNPILGRTLSAEEASIGMGRVVLLSYGFWRQYLGSDRSMVGKAISLDNQPYTIVGVMPQGFAFPDQFVDVWIPASGVSTSRNVRDKVAIARLKPGVKLREAQTELNMIAKRLTQDYPEDEGLGFTAVSLQGETAGPVKAALMILLGAVGCVLLIACVNVAILLLTWSARRQREIAVRAALGAGRRRLIRQLLTEALVLTFVGGCLGLIVTLLAIPVIPAVAATRILRLNYVRVDGWVFAFTFVISLLTGVVFGIIPAIRASKPDLIANLKEGNMTSQVGFGLTPHRRAQSVLMSCQVALAMILLIGAGLVARSFSRLMSVRLGFDPHHLLVVRLSETTLMPLGNQAMMLFYQRALAEVNALPDVESAALVTASPVEGRWVMTSVYLEGRTYSTPWGAPTIHYQDISPGYFATMRIPILAGRAFTEEDRYGSPRVAIVNETMARRFWPDGNAVGKRIDVGGGGQWCEIVAVAHDARDISLDREPGPEVYRPYLQRRWLESALVVRTTIQPKRLGDAVVSRIWSVDKDERVLSVMTMEDVISKSVVGPRFHAALLGLFALLALFLAVVGVYGVASYSVSRRTREIGIRVALGARPRDVLMLVVGQQFAFTITGVVIGLGGAFALTRTISSLLYAVSPTDPGTFVGAAALLSFSTLVASYIPARRATRVDPSVTLRYE
jgi:putative ABC transport system permease protein